jgi:DNA repair exonuclease SbcCD ATPase subunit
MIRYLALSNWRTFGQLELHLDPGTTFIVAENGVGKTSLVQAAAWALFGRRANIDPHRAIRKGADTAKVTVELELPDQTSLRIRRSISKTEAVEAIHDGQTLRAEALDQLLANQFGADLDYLARITVLPGDTLADQAEESFQLQRHLCQMFGVEDLQRAADEAAQLHKRLDTENKKLRTVVRRADTDERALQARLNAARRTVAELEERRDALQRELEAARTTLDAAERAATAAEQHRIRTRAAADVATQATELLGQPVEAHSVDIELDLAEQAAVVQLDELRRRMAAARGELDIIERAVGALADADAACPVCRRPLSAHDAKKALTEHHRDRERLATELDRLQQEEVADAKRMTRMRDLRRALGPGPVVVDTPGEPVVPIGKVREAVANLRTQSDAIHAQLAEHRHLATLAEQELTEHRQATEQSATALARYRLEAVSGVVAESLAAAASEILSTRIEPLANEVMHRWKRVFGDQGTLRLGANGGLSIVRGAQEVPFEDFSSGEKVIALLAARLLIVTASTAVTFMWLDEPLEHLDPPNRRILASLITTTSRPVRQVLVTTYEESLARRLAEQIPHVALRYIKSDMTIP